MDSGTGEPFGAAPDATTVNVDPVEPLARDGKPTLPLTAPVEKGTVVGNAATGTVTEGAGVALLGVGDGTAVAPPVGDGGSGEDDPPLLPQATR